MLKQLKDIPSLSRIIFGLDKASEKEAFRLRDLIVEHKIKNHLIQWNNGPGFKSIYKKLNEAGFNNETGANNIFFGNRAGHSNEDGINSIFLGLYAGYGNTVSNNIFIGNESGRYNTTGTFNSFIGYRSGYNNKTGSSNIFIGDSAGLGGANQSCSYNILL